MKVRAIKVADYKIYEKTCKEMRNKGYEKTEAIFSAGYAMSFGLLAPIPVMIILGAIYYIRWEGIYLFEWNLLYVLAGICLTTIVHELIHGIVWSCFCKGGFKNIKFGFNKGMPYCHCEVPLNKGGYITGAIAPLLILGGGLFIISLFISSPSLFILMMVNVLMAGGDVLIVMKAAKTGNKSYFIDHPNLPGFVAFKND